MNGIRYSGMCFLWMAFLGLHISVSGSNYYRAHQKVIDGKPSIIYGIPTDKLLRVPPPDAFFEKSGRTLDIQVRYFNFPSNARAAFQHAVDIWSKLLVSDQTIHISAYWRSLGTGVLGSCGPTNYYRNYDGMPQADVYYPLPLAEKLARKDLNEPGESDIIANFSSTANWYYGTDGQTPAGKYDLTTVVLHELCHGLGFIGSFSVDDGLGSWGWETGSPFSFDLFLEDLSSKKLVDTTVYANSSVALRNALAGARVFFRGPVVNSLVNKRVSMYAPTIWDDGSSIYHVNPLYVSGNDRLMNPSINTQTSIHDPGLIAMGMMGDMGWMNIDIEHEQVVSTENLGEIEILARFTSDFDSPVLNPSLHYQVDSADFVTVPFNTQPNSDGFLTASIFVDKPVDINYYITVADKLERTFKRPVSSPQTNYHFVVGPDTTPPSIVHFHGKFLMPGQDSVALLAVVEDLFGIDSVIVEYFVNENAQPNIGMNNEEGNKYRGAIQLGALNLQYYDSIRYRIVAYDKANARNAGYFPDSGYVSLVLEPIPDFINYYADEFEVDAGAFIMQGFEVSIPNDFANGALHTHHPYEFAGENNSLEYVAQLRFPVKIAQTNAHIRFDEIVLVEPGEPGTVYGDDEFWDYVIVEGSKDKGKSWKPFKPGWDSRRITQWESLYKQTENNQFSRGIGSPDLYREQLINMVGSGSFLPGDTVLIRFRLFSDPYAYGWGWAIDNLKIQDQGTSRREILASDIKLYPNPVSNGSVSISFPSIDGTVSLGIYDISGQQVYGTQNVVSGQTLTMPLHLQGLYFAVVKTGTQSFRQKLVFK